MKESVVHGITLDECISCGAFWFDAGELENYLSARLDNKKEDILLTRFVPTDMDSLYELCPKCEKERLGQGKIGELSLSRCRRCNGFFVGKNQISAGRNSTCRPLVEELLIQLVGEAVLSFLDGL